MHCEVGIMSFTKDITNFKSCNTSCIFMKPPMVTRYGSPLGNDWCCVLKFICIDSPRILPSVNFLEIKTNIQITRYSSTLTDLMRSHALEIYLPGYQTLQMYISYLRGYQTLQMYTSWQIVQGLCTRGSPSWGVSRVQLVEKKVKFCPIACKGSPDGFRLTPVAL